jgi:hypothetical protein
MPADKRERMIESLAVAAALGFLVLFVAGVSLAVDSQAIAVETTALVADPSTISLVGRPGDPSFERLYRISDGSSVSYGVVLSLRSASSSALVAARLSRLGELKGLRLLGSASAKLPADAVEICSLFPGADEAIGRACAAVRSAEESGS